MDVRWGEQKEVDRKRRKTIDDIMVAGGRELIDTLWNVNIHIGIKGAKGNVKIPPLKELIDTLWNVNIHIGIKGEYGVLELIDTLWNVNRIAVSTAIRFA